MTTAAANLDVEQRARSSLGISGRAIYEMVGGIVRRRSTAADRLCDVGCGAGAFVEFARTLCQTYCGVDVVRYDAYPPGVEFLQADLDAAHWPIEDDFADVTVAIETIEHMENPRAFFRELARITRPGGLIVVTTPNQLSLLGKLTLIFKNRFNAFQDGSYPAHRTALLEIDLLRIAIETGLRDPQIHYTNRGRIPGTAWHWPIVGGRSFSDSLAVSTIRRPQ